MTGNDEEYSLCVRDLLRMCDTALTFRITMFCPSCMRKDHSLALWGVLGARAQYEATAQYERTSEMHVCHLKWDPI